MGTHLPATFCAMGPFSGRLMFGKGLLTLVVIRRILIHIIHGYNQHLKVDVKLLSNVI
jgi:hypothetical protein